MRFVPVRRAKRFPVCAVCGKGHAPVFDFRVTLARYRIAGEFAAAECIRRLIVRRLDRARRS